MAIRRVALLSAQIRSRAISRGILGTSPMWRAVAVVYFGRRFLKKLLGKKPDDLGTEKLKPGQFLQIATIPPPSRRDRRGRRGTRRRTV